MAPVETMRDESSLMIIEKEVQAKEEREEKFSERCLIIFALSCSHLKSSRGRPSRPEKEGMACRGERDVAGTLRIELL